MNKHTPKSAKFQEIILHFVFTPKYRRAVFTGDVAARLDELVRQVCTRLDVELIALAIQPDHVHILIVQPRQLAVADFAQQVKWWSSLHLRRQFPALRADRALWGRDFFVRSVGGGRRAVRKYIDDQS